MRRRVSYVEREPERLHSSYQDEPIEVCIGVQAEASHIWDASTVAALDAITTKYEKHGKRVVIQAMNDASTEMHTRLAGKLGGES